MANEAGYGVPDLPSVDAFLCEEAELLDGRRFDEWVQLFLPEGYYWVPAEHGQDSPVTTASIIYDDLPMLQARAARLKHPMLFTNIPPIRTVHAYSNVRIAEVDAQASACLVRSKLIVVESRADDQRVFGATCHHRLCRGEGGLRIAWKKVELVNCESHLDALTIPF
jgi:3-phenylpropionate/cinnamic acid dioxygenase small subunit